MGLLQSDVRHRRGNGTPRLSEAGTSPPAFTVHGLDHAAAALAAAAEAGTPILLLSVFGAATSVGAGWFRALLNAAADTVPEARFTGILDCEDAPGAALAALHVGINVVRYDGPAASRLADIAAQRGATILRHRPHALDLAAIDRPRIGTACRAWIAEAHHRSPDGSGEAPQ